MSTYTLGGLADFILRLFKEENEEEIYDLWLYKGNEMDYKEFKEKILKQIKKTKHRTLSRAEEEENIRNATRFIKPINKGGEK